MYDTGCTFTLLTAEAGEWWDGARDEVVKVKGFTGETRLARGGGMLYAMMRDSAGDWRVENLGTTYDAVLAPVIGRQVSRRGRSQFVKLGDKEVDFDANFKLYLQTKLSNPHYPPEIQAETTLINFTVTQAGLSDQLNVLVLGKERADLSEMSEVLVKQQTGFKIKMGELEDEILDRLANAEGDITEDVELIEGLEETKRISTDRRGRQISVAASARWRGGAAPSS